MTAKLIKSALVMVMAVALTAGMPAAGERMKAYEMGESGQVVFFSMTPEEIAAEDMQTARLAALRESRSEEPVMVTFEMAESGEVISFPASAEEIKTAERQAAENAAKKTASKPKGVQNPKVVVEEYELCECGEIITFPRTNKKAERLPGN